MLFGIGPVRKLVVVGGNTLLASCPRVTQNLTLSLDDLAHQTN